MATNPIKTGFSILTSTASDRRQGYPYTVRDDFFLDEEEAKENAFNYAKNVHGFEGELTWHESNSHGKVLTAEFVSQREGLATIHIFELIVREPKNSNAKLVLMETEV